MSISNLLELLIKLSIFCATDSPQNPSVDIRPFDADNEGMSQWSGDRFSCLHHQPYPNPDLLWTVTHLVGIIGREIQRKWMD